MAEAADKSVERVALGALFGEFLRASLCAFGGGLVWVRRAVVDRRQWVSDAEFADILSLCQFLPGTPIVSIAVCVGEKLRGPRGALAAVTGFTVIPCAVGFAIGGLYLQYADIRVLQGMLSGVGAAAAGLIIATGVRLLIPHRQRSAALLFAAAAFIGLAFAHFSLLAVILTLAPISIAVAGIEAARAK